MKRNHLVDIIKGVCIIFVVIEHCLSWFNYTKTSIIFPYLLDLPIPVFMILSGYVSALSFERHGITSMRKAYNINFVLNKLIHYVLPFLIIFIPELLLNIKNGESYSFYDILCNFFHGGWGYGTYYFPVMLQFVFFFPVIYFIVKRYDLAGVFVCGILNAVFEFLQWIYYIGEGYYRLLVFRYFLVIGFGCYLFTRKGKPKKSLGILCALIGAVFIGVWYYGGYNPLIIIHWTGTSFVASLYLIPLVGILFTSPKCMKLKCPPLEFLGKRSYHIFLSQMFFYQYIIYQIYLFAPQLSLTVMNLISLAACIGMGSVFYLVEGKISHLLIKGMERLNPENQIQKAIDYINSHFS